jgi:hypothetical protein
VRNAFQDAADALKQLIAQCERANWPANAEQMDALSRARETLGALPRLSDPHPLVPIEGQIRCVEREINLRRDVYSRRVAKGTMTQAKSAEEIAAMVAVLQTLQLLDRDTRLV